MRPRERLATSAWATGLSHLPARLAPPRPWQRNAVFATIGLSIVLGWVGDALWAGLVDTHPLVLLALNAKPRYQILTVNSLDPWTYYSFTTARLLFTKPLVWMVGAWYGHRAVEWARRRSPRGGAVIAWVQDRFGRFGWLIVVVTSNNVICLLAGSSGFYLSWFMVLAAAGTLVRLWAVDVVGERFSGPIDEVIGFVGDHRPATIAVSVAVVGLGLWWQHRSGRSQLDELSDLERAVEAETGE